MLIVFVECGLFFPFLPGDTLLFALGLFIATEKINLFGSTNPFVELLARARPAHRRRGRGQHRRATRSAGPSALRSTTATAGSSRRSTSTRPRPSSTSTATRRSSSAASCRSCAPSSPWSPGVTRMERRRFFLWSFVGAVMWVVSITLLGYLLGAKFPAIGTNIDKAILSILAFSVIPIAYEWWRHRRTSGEQAEDDDGRRPVPRRRRPGHHLRAELAAGGVELRLGEHRAGPRGPRPRAGSGPRGCGRSRRPPSRRSRRRPAAPGVASRTAPPVVMTSSTSVIRRPATSGPSASLQVPYSLAFLRTKRAGRPVRALSTATIGTPPSSRPPSSSVSSGSSGCICATTRASRSGWASKRYLSKYSDATVPERSVNSPVSRQTASMSRARSGSAADVMGPTLGQGRGAGGGYRHRRDPATRATAGRRPADDLHHDVRARGPHRLGEPRAGLPRRGRTGVGGRGGVPGAARGTQPVRPGPRRPRAPPGRRAAPAGALRHRPGPGQPGRRHRRAPPRPSPPPCSRW